MLVRVAGVHKKLTGSFVVLRTQICGKFFLPIFFLKPFSNPDWSHRMIEKFRFAIKKVRDFGFSWFCSILSICSSENSNVWMIYPSCSRQLDVYVLSICSSDHFNLWRFFLMINHSIKYVKAVATHK